MAGKAQPNEISIIRIYDASVEAVWDAWADPKKTSQWWGPRGFTITNKSKDMTPGGTWVYTMHGPDGVDFPNTTKYFEVEKCAKLVYDHGASVDRPPLFRVTVLFSEENGKTEMDMTMALPTAEAAQKIRQFIKQAGGDATWDRLAEFLAKETSGKDKFVINRSFDVPVETMYEVWTNPAHIQKWLPPSGFEMTYLKSDIRKGGGSFYSMSNNAGMKMYGRAEYQELTKPNRIVYTQQFTDEKGNISRHPLAQTWPETMLTTVTLSPEDTNRTRVTVEWEVFGSATPEELSTFIHARAGMTQGWTGSFDKLEAYLSK